MLGVLLGLAGGLDEMGFHELVQADEFVSRKDTSLKPWFQSGWHVSFGPPRPWWFQSGRPFSIDLFG